MSTTQDKYRSTTDQPTGARPTGPSRRRYHRDALAAVVAMLRAASPDAADLFVALVAARGERRGPGERAIDRTGLARIMGLDHRAIEEFDGRLIERVDDLAAVLSIAIVDPILHRNVPASRSRDTTEDRPDQSQAWFVETDDAAADEGSAGTMLLSSEFVALLDDPLPKASRSTLAARLDQASQQDVAMVRALVASDTGGHLAFRRRPHGARDAADLAARLAAEDIDVFAYDGHAQSCVAALVRAELHAGASPPIVIVERDLLTEGPQDPDADDWDAPIEPTRADGVTDLARAIPKRLCGSRGVVLWSVPERYHPSSVTLPWIGACIGPQHHDPRWVRQVVADHLGLVDPATSAGVTALARRAGDPRDVGAMAAFARAMAVAGLGDIDVTCGRVAASFTTDHSDRDRSGAPFDARLLVCGDGAHRLLASAREAAANGVRVLAYGPPGGGKSAYVRELGRRMAGHGPVRMIGPADFLAKAWGATERLVRDLWRRAADDGAVLVLDEAEVVFGRRVPGDMSNNALLVRSLTDAFVLGFDEHPEVALLATTNDRAAIDGAVLRRFAFVERFEDRLSPDQEKLAWTILLHCHPPSGWSSVGAAVADFVLAAQRCRMLGLIDAGSLQKSIAEAKNARLGTKTPSIPATVNSTSHH